MKDHALVRSGKSPRSAFTLIELLVVVAIIALLISILLPSLQRAREQAKQVVCLSNMRGVGQAFTMYAESFNGVWPSAVDSFGMQNRWPVPFFLGGIIDGQLNDYDAAGEQILDGGESIFICPSEGAQRTIRDWRMPNNSIDRVEIGGSYAYSGEIHRNGELLELGDDDTPPFLNRVDRMRQQAEVFALFDNFKPIERVQDFGWRFYRDTFFRGYRTMSGAEVPAGAIADRFKIIGDRHNGSANALAYDTHAKSIKPDRVEFKQVSWTFGGKYPVPPPGGR